MYVPVLNAIIGGVIITIHVSYIIPLFYVLKSRNFFYALKYIAAVHRGIVRVFAVAL